MSASILICSYKRALFLKHCLDALCKQTVDDFDVIIILKPSGDGSEQVIEAYKDRLSVKVIHQTEGFFIDAVKIGLGHTKGAIIVFLDDDSIAQENLIEEHLKQYNNNLKIGGVSGNVISASLKCDDILAINPYISEVIPNKKRFLTKISRSLWRRPLPGMDDFFFYISKAGMVERNTEMNEELKIGVTKSLLAMGANMSVLADAIKGITLPTSWILGLGNEQYIGWYIWRHGYTTLFNPKAVVYHISHGETLSRGNKGKNLILKSVENSLLFSRLYGLEPGLSTMHRIIWLVYEILYILKTKSNLMNRLQAVIIGEFIGLKWRFSSKHRQYNKNDLINLK